MKKITIEDEIKTLQTTLSCYTQGWSQRPIAALRKTIRRLKHIQRCYNNAAKSQDTQASKTKHLTLPRS